MTKRRHVLALADIVARHVAARPRHEARLAASHLRCVAEERDVRLARELGTLELVERARDEHLASLGSDDGLTVLCVDWEDVVAEAVRQLDAEAPHCARCGARLPRQRRVCSRCRQPAPGRT